LKPLSILADPADNLLSAMDTTLLITVSGRDRPGVTAALMAALEDCAVVVTDIEQIVINGRLTLGLLITCSDGSDERTLPTVERIARSIGEEMDLDIDILNNMVPTASDRQVTSGHLLVTVLGLPLRPSGVSAISSRILDNGGNISRIRRVASYPVTAIEFEVTGADQMALRAQLAETAASAGVDVAVQRAGLTRMGTHLMVMDVDSTLIQDEVIELLAAHAGAHDAVADITERAMRGEIDFAASIHERVALLAGLDASVIDKVRDQIRLTPGARTLTRTLSRLGYHLALVSGGFIEVIQPIADDLGIKHVRANSLEIRDGRLTGRVHPPILDRAGKAAALRELAHMHGIPMERTIGVGDGANDLDMLSAAGLGIAFNAKPLVRAAADAAINVPFLDAILYLLGITREQVEESDAQAGLRTPIPHV
jgi:phosphoserine phosphatase